MIIGTALTSPITKQDAKRRKEKKIDTSAKCMKMECFGFGYHRQTVGAALNEETWRLGKRISWDYIEKKS